MPDTGGPGSLYLFDVQATPIQVAQTKVRIQVLLHGRLVEKPVLRPTDHEDLASGTNVDTQHGGNGLEPFPFQRGANIGGWALQNANKKVWLRITQLFQ